MYPQICSKGTGKSGRAEEVRLPLPSITLNLANIDSSTTVVQEGKPSHLLKTKLPPSSGPYATQGAFLRGVKASPSAPPPPHSKAKQGQTLAHANIHFGCDMRDPDCRILPDLTLTKQARVLRGTMQAQPIVSKTTGLKCMKGVEAN